MKRILIIDRFFFPDEQATSVYLTELTTLLATKFHFQVLSGPPAVVTEKSTPPPPVQVFQVSCLHLPKRFLWGRLMSDVSFLLTALIRGLFLPRPDLMVSQTSPPGIWWVVFVLSRWHRTPWIHISKDVFPDNLIAMRPGKKSFFLSLLKKLSDFPLKRAVRTVVIGEDMKKKFLEKGLPESSLFKICDWVDPNFIKPLPKSVFWNASFDGRSKFVVLYAGNFGRSHNFEDLLGAAENLKNNPKIHFTLVGDGSMKKSLENEARDRGLPNFSIVSFEPRSRLPLVLASADASVILLRKGLAGLSVPSKIYSILAAGRPVIACVDEQSDIAEMVKESNSGFVVPPGNISKFVKVIRCLAGNSKLRIQMGKNARRYAEEKDFKTRALQGYQRVFNMVLNSGIH